MQRHAWLFLVSALVCLASSAVRAHHSSSAFNREEVIAFEGTVTRLDWTHPHVYLVIEDMDGIEWLIETGALPVMMRSGWTRDSFAPGDAVIVRANPDRDRSENHGLLLSIAHPGGDQFASMTLTLRRAVLDSDASTSDLAGVWHGDPALTAVFMSALASHPLTEQGSAAQAQYQESMDPTAECIPWPSPFVVAANGLYLSEVELNDNTIVFRNEFYNTERVVYTDGREHPENAERTIQGHSIGWWENEALVVDTRFFADHRSPVPITGIPSGEQKHVVERYTLSDDGKEVFIEIFLEDPEYLAEPITANLTWKYSPHLEMLGAECELEIARRYIQ